jgi:ubiquinol-cytochrome c reductase cytochrome b subunit
MRNKLLGWIDDRFPLRRMGREYLTQYYVPKNFNFWYYFGSLALVVLANQIITGIWLAMFYTPTEEGAFASVQYIMRDVNFGWLLRYMHAVGASLFFLVIYLHIFRALLYGSYQKPRELVWLVGMTIYLFLVAEAFMGYLLPWGQMSYWGATVITSLVSAIPYIGDYLITWIRGDYNISGVTLNRFYALHIIGIPLGLLFLVWMHVMALHQVGSNNPDGVDIKKLKSTEGKPLDGIPFHPYYTVKDLFGISVFLLIFFAIVFFAPDFYGYFLEHDNFEQANALKTPEDISPMWYLSPFYAMLRAIPNKLLGVIIMQAGIIILFLLPWLDQSTVRSIRYRGIYYKIALTFFVFTFLSLMYLGLQPVTRIRSTFALMFTTLYFLFFLLMPIYTKFDRNKVNPERVK